ncbi:MAG: VCBS repeat-containing protein, partial [Myxococcales bacterium]|nr:VCBS repeat-containing protein [Myxococcales bacterium]
VVEGLEAPVYAAGDQTLSASGVAADFDGDGRLDAVIGVTEADVSGFDSGGAFVHRGVEGGVDPVPARVIAGTGRSDQLGRSLAVGDLDKDGHPDLVVGNNGADSGAVDSGAVLIYRGTGDAALLADAPAQVLSGPFGGDQLGYGVAVCDFNGDGWLDVAAGARFAEDRTQSPQSASQGAVHVYLGGPGGVSTGPNQSLWGAVPDGAGAWAPRADLQLGWTVAAGDFDGDGHCDLAATAINYGAAAGRTLDGAVFLWRGRAPAGLSPGGVSATPELAFAGADEVGTASRLGWSLAMGDLDGDGKAELVVGQPYFTNGTYGNNGAVRIVRGRALTGGAATALAPPEDADWTWVGGNESGDQMGWWVAVADWDGVGPADLFVGDLLDEAPGGTNNTGTVIAFPARAGELPDAEAAVRLPGDTNGQRFGMAFAVVGDTDGDGLSEVVARAAYDSADGPRLGRHVLRRSDAAATLEALEYPVASAGSELGASVAWIPRAGRGPALAVGAPRAQATPLEARSRAGAVFVWDLDAGAEAAPQALDGFPGHSSSDRFGEALAPLGDFDGDGIADLAVVARDDDSGSACGSNRNNSGAAYVFRGQADGTLAAAPAFTYWGDQANQNLYVVAGADLDGDGL